jgi:hypothetical protein
LQVDGDASVVVPSAVHCVPGHPQEFEDDPDYQQDDPDCPEDRETCNEPDDQCIEGGSAYF